MNFVKLLHSWLINNLLHFCMLPAVVNDITDMRVCENIYTHVYIHTYISIHTEVYAHAYIYTSIYIHPHTHPHIYVFKT